MTYHFNPQVLNGGESKSSFDQTDFSKLLISSSPITAQSIPPLPVSKSNTQNAQTLTSFNHTPIFVSMVDILKDIRIILQSTYEQTAHENLVQSKTIQKLTQGTQLLSKAVDNTGRLIDKSRSEIINISRSGVENQVTTRKFLAINANQNFKNFFDEAISPFLYSFNHLAELQADRLKDTSNSLNISIASLRQFTTTSTMLLSKHTTATQDTLQVVLLSGIYDVLRLFALESRASSRGMTVEAIGEEINRALTFGFFDVLGSQLKRIVYTAISPIAIPIRAAIYNVKDIVNKIKGVTDWAWKAITGYHKKEAIVKKYIVKKPPEVLTAEAITQVPNLLERVRVVLTKSLDIQQNMFYALQSLTGVDYVKTQNTNERVFVKELGQMLTKAEFDDYQTKLNKNILKDVRKNFIFRSRPEREALANKLQGRINKENDFTSERNVLTDLIDNQEIKNRDRVNDFAHRGIGVNPLVIGIRILQSMSTSLLAIVSNTVKMTQELATISSNSFNPTITITAPNTDCCEPSPILLQNLSNIETILSDIRNNNLTRVVIPTESISVISRQEDCCEPSPIIVQDLSDIKTILKDIRDDDSTQIKLPTELSSAFDLWRRQLQDQAVLDTAERLSLIRNQRDAGRELIIQDNSNIPPEIIEESQEKKSFLSKLLGWGGLALTWMSGKISSLFSSLTASLGDVIKRKLGDLVSSVASMFRSISASIAAKFPSLHAAIGSVISKLSSGTSTALKTVTSTVISGLKFALPRLFSRLPIIGPIVEFIIGWFSAKKDDSASVWDSVKGGLKRMLVSKSYLGNAFKFALYGLPFGLPGIVGGALVGVAVQGIYDLFKPKEGGGKKLDILGMVGNFIKKHATSNTILGNAFKYGAIGFLFGNIPGLFIGMAVGTVIQVIADIARDFSLKDIGAWVKEKSSIIFTKITDSIYGLISNIVIHVSEMLVSIKDNLIIGLYELASKLHIDSLVKLTLNENQLKILREKHADAPIENAKFNDDGELVGNIKGTRYTLTRDLLSNNPIVVDSKSIFKMASEKGVTFIEQVGDFVTLEYDGLAFRAPLEEFQNFIKKQSKKSRINVLSTELQRTLEGISFDLDSDQIKLVTDNTSEFVTALYSTISEKATDALGSVPNANMESLVDRVLASNPEIENALRSTVSSLNSGQLRDLIERSSNYIKPKSDLPEVTPSTQYAFSPITETPNSFQSKLLPDTGNSSLNFSPVKMDGQHIPSGGQLLSRYREYDSATQTNLLLGHIYDVNRQTLVESRPEEETDDSFMDLLFGNIVGLAKQVASIDIKTLIEASKNQSSDIVLSLKEAGHSGFTQLFSGSTPVTSSRSTSGSTSGIATPKSSSNATVAVSPDVSDPRVEMGAKIYHSVQDELVNVYGFDPEAAKSLAHFAVGQSAMETGWFKTPTGSNAFFGIKADSRWTGPTSSIRTHEYEGGSRVGIRDDFRAYDSPEDSARDWVKFLHENKRYSELVAAARNGASTEELVQLMARTGYATNPNYERDLGGTVNGRTLLRLLPQIESVGTVVKPKPNPNPDLPITASTPLTQEELALRVKTSDGQVKTVSELGITSRDQLASLGGQAFAGGYNDPLTTFTTAKIQEFLGPNFGRLTAQNDTYHKRHAPKSRHTQGVKTDFTVTGMSYSDAHAKIAQELSSRYGLIEGQDFKIISTPHGTGPHIDFELKSSGQEKMRGFMSQSLPQTILADADTKDPALIPKPPQHQFGEVNPILETANDWNFRNYEATPIPVDETKSQQTPKESETNPNASYLVQNNTTPNRDGSGLDVTPIDPFADSIAMNLFNMIPDVLMKSIKSQSFENRDFNYFENV